MSSSGSEFPAHRPLVGGHRTAGADAAGLGAGGVARAQRLVKGYGETHERGWRSFERVLGQLPQLQASARGTQQLKALTQAALADDTGQALGELLVSMRGPGDDARQPSYPALTETHARLNIRFSAGDTP